MSSILSTVPINVNFQSPFVIFLDIDGVIYNTPNQDGVFKKVAELFPNHKGSYSNKMCGIAASHFFDKSSLENLNEIIRSVKRTRDVWIVISSSWRQNRTIEELRETIFVIHDFSKHIVDKTPDEIVDEEVALYCPVKSHSENSRVQCRAAHIMYWLKQHPEVTHYAILDDDDDHLSDNFGERFFKTDRKNLLTQEISGKILSHLSH